MEYIIWIGLIILFCIIETATFNLVTIWFAFGSVAALFMYIAGFGPTAQIWTFVIVSIILLALTRPIIKNKLKIKSEKTNADRLIGDVGYVVDDISPEKFSGKVTVRGQEWSAISKNGNLIETGSRVDIVGMEGVKLIVTKKEEDVL